MPKNVRKSYLCHILRRGSQKDSRSHALQKVFRLRSPLSELLPPAADPQASARYPPPLPLQAQHSRRCRILPGTTSSMATVSVGAGRTANITAINLLVDSDDWGKALAGEYTATITFTAEVVAE